MIVRFESANPALARIVEVNADKNCIFLRILDSHTIIQFDKDIRVAGHHSFQLRFAELSVEALGDIEGDRLFRWTVTAICAAVFAAMSRVYYDSIKGFSCILDPGSRDGTASSQRSEKSDRNETNDLAQHV